MNMFATLAEPMRCRPGDYIPAQPKPKAEPAERRPRKKAPPNPWRLPYGQCAVLDALVLYGSNQEVARVLRISKKTVSCHIELAKHRMGVGTRMLAVLEWDRFTRGRWSSMVASVESAAV